MSAGLPPIHPGQVLKEEFMVPFNLSINALGCELHVAPNRISQLINGKRAMSADTALRLAEFFGTTPQFWMNLQSLYELEVAKRSKEGAAKRRLIRKYSSLSNYRPTSTRVTPGDIHASL